MGLLEDYESRKNFGYPVFLYTMCTAGLVGNTLSGLVLLRKDIRTSVTCLVLGLAFSDSILLASAIFSTYDGQKENDIQTLIKYFGQSCSVFFTLSINAERYIVVCHPLKARSLCTVKKALFTGICCAGAALVLTIPLLWCRELEAYCWVIWPTLHFIFPYTVLIVLNVRIYKRTREMAKRRAIMTQSEEVPDNSFTRMLLCVVLLFGICSSPRLFDSFYIFFYYFWDDTFIKFYFDYIFVWEDVLYLFNSSFNFVIYCVVGTKFRKSFVQMWKEVFYALNCLCTFESKRSLPKATEMRIGQPTLVLQKVTSIA